MVARCAPSPALAIRFERDGEDSIVIDAPDGRRAVIRTVTLLLAHAELRPGDKVIVEAAE